MMSFLAASLLALNVSASSISDESSYTEFSTYMSEWGYTWEPLQVLTDDNYTLTTFHITGTNSTSSPNSFQTDRNSSYSPVVLMYGIYGDAVSWLKFDVTGLKPTPLRLFDDGFDVYLASNRGTKYCQTHTEYTIADEQFWDWSWSDMGLYDDIANIKKVQQLTGAEKVNYLGFSQGTIQMFYSLAHLESSFLGENLNTFVAMAPCTIWQSGLGDWWYSAVASFPDYGVYYIGGDDYAYRHYTICQNFDENVCYAAGYYYGAEPVSVKQMTHWGYNELQQRYQEYAVNYQEGDYITDLIPIDSISTVPISLFVGLQDTTCTYAQAEITYETIGERITYFNEFWEADHVFWGSPLEDSVYEQVKQRLITPEERNTINAKDLGYPQW